MASFISDPKHPFKFGGTMSIFADEKTHVKVILA